jgi:hypothetical protein
MSVEIRAAKLHYTTSNQGDSPNASELCLGDTRWEKGMMAENFQFISANHVIYNSLFTNSPVVLHYKMWKTEGVTKWTKNECYVSRLRWSCGQTIGLRPFDCGECGFAFHWEQGYSSFVLVCCAGSDPWDELIIYSEAFYRVYVCVCVCFVCLILSDLETSTMRRPRPELGGLLR